MADERAYEGQAIPDGERVGFCQDCGRPLTAATVRNVGSGVFCEPCLERRIAAGPTSAPGATGYAAGQPGAAYPGWQTTGGAYPPPPPVPPPPPGTIYTGVPTPWLAGLLGFIPGVGAMYNGQFAKGVVHLIVFAVLVSLSDHVSSVFGLFVAGWIFFMAFEAYHTARARRDGLPLPDPFGWNNIGERLGFGKNWPGSFTGGVPPTPGNATWHQPPPPPNAPQGSDWVGYVPPTNYSTTPGAPVPPPVQAVDVPAASVVVPTVTPIAPYQPPVVPPYGTNVPYSDVNAGNMPPVVVPARRFPVGAIWLIGLGLLFLVGNINHSLHLSWRWMGPLFIAGFAIYLLVSRLRAVQAADTLGRPFANRISLFRGPVIMLTVAVLLALQSFDALTFGQTWPVLLIVIRAFLTIERSAARRNFAGPVPVMDSDVNASPAAWNAPKGGQ